MKVLLTKDVPKLGRAGDVKKVADGYGRNYLIPHGLAMLATPGAMKQAERIKAKADERRAILNNEMSGIANIIKGQMVSFGVRASETGRLYGSVTTRMISDSITERFGVEINHRQVEVDPLRMLGIYTVPVRLTIDLAPEITVVVHREGETPAALMAAAEEEVFEAEAEEETPTETA